MNGAYGTSDIEGEATRVGASELGQRTSFKRLTLVVFLSVGLLFVTGCSRKPAQAPPNAPEVLVTTVAPQDVPRVLERVATLDGFINANINAQVQGYIVSRVYQEGSVVKKGDLLFQIDPRPFEAALAQA
jgi:membrane fusion protein (multidrug efflux system)